MRQRRLSYCMWELDDRVCLPSSWFEQEQTRRWQMMSIMCDATIGLHLFGVPFPSILSVCKPGFAESHSWRYTWNIYKWGMSAGPQARRVAAGAFWGTSKGRLKRTSVLGTAARDVPQTFHKIKRANRRCNGGYSQIANLLPYHSAFHFLS